MKTLEDILEDFELLEDWADRYRYIIDLGRELPPFPEEARTEANRVQGCVSQVWLVADQDQESRMHFSADSDAHIVRGLAALLTQMFDGKSPEDIAAFDPRGVLEKLELAEHLSPSRTNGLFAMVERIKSLAKR